jgi:hypothetical protein
LNFYKNNSDNDEDRSPAASSSLFDAAALCINHILFAPIIFLFPTICNASNEPTIDQAADAIKT